jgi:glucan phosphoethanolaminetransferase (alkaline phosphatase superfamily)
MHRKDLVAAQIIKDLLRNDEPHFIYFVKNGAHWPYEGKYPAGKAPFKPHMTPNEAPGENLEHMENSYKNTILWVVGEFFDELLDDLDLSDHIIIYTADHAQHLNHKRQGGFMSHCSTYNEHPTEGLVPMLTITHSPKFGPQLQDAANMNFDKTSHYNLFSTLLSLFGYPEQEVFARYGGGLMQPISEKQEYLVVPLFVRFGRPLRWRPIPQRESLSTL